MGVGGLEVAAARSRSLPPRHRLAPRRCLRRLLALRPVLGVGEVEAATGVPGGTLVAVGGDPAGVLEDAGEVEHVPGGEGGVAVGEVVLGAAGALVEVGGA